MRITKAWTFEMAHRLIQGYPGKCAHLHGHSYRVEVCVHAAELNHYGMVTDFDTIKTTMREWVDRFLDHATIVVPEDTVLLQFLRDTKQKHYVLEAPNATAENIADLLLAKFSEMAEAGCSIYTVRVWETATSSAVAGD